VQAWQPMHLRLSMMNPYRIRKSFQRAAGGGLRLVYCIWPSIWCYWPVWGGNCSTKIIRSNV